MRPLPIPAELLEAWNAEAGPRTFARITMLPPDGPTLADGTPCDPVEVIVESRLPASDEERNAVLTELLRRGVEKMPDELRIPTRFYVRVGVSERDVRLIERAGMFWLSVWGAGFSPFAVWAEDGDEGERPMAEQLAGVQAKYDELEAAFDRVQEELRTALSELGEGTDDEPAPLDNARRALVRALFADDAPTT